LAQGAVVSRAALLHARAAWAAMVFIQGGRRARQRCACAAAVACGLLVQSRLQVLSMAWAASQAAGPRVGWATVAAPAHARGAACSTKGAPPAWGATVPTSPALASHLRAGACSAASAASQGRLDTAGSVDEVIGGGTLWVNRPGQRSFEVRWQSGDTVGDLKAVVQEATNIPPSNQELRSNGVELFPDGQSLEEWALSAGGVAATAGGKAPDIWLFDGRSEDERAAVDPPAGSYEEDEGLDVFRLLFYLLVVLPLTVYVGTQALGINPFEQQVPLPEPPDLDFVEYEEFEYF